MQKLDKDALFCIITYLPVQEFFSICQVNKHLNEQARSNASYQYLKQHMLQLQVEKFKNSNKLHKKWQREIHKLGKRQSKNAQQDFEKLVFFACVNNLKHFIRRDVHFPFTHMMHMLLVPYFKEEHAQVWQKLSLESKVTNHMPHITYDTKQQDDMMRVVQYLQRVEISNMEMWLNVCCYACINFRGTWMSLSQECCPEQTKNRDMLEMVITMLKDRKYELPAVDGAPWLWCTTRDREVLATLNKYGMITWTPGFETKIRRSLYHGTTDLAVRVKYWIHELQVPISPAFIQGVIYSTTLPIELFKHLLNMMKPPHKVTDIANNNQTIMQTLFTHSINRYRLEHVKEIIARSTKVDYPPEYVF